MSETVALILGYACSKIPPWMVLFIGACACFFGYGLIWLSVTQTLHGLPV